jgi:hypothetical protein
MNANELLNLKNTCTNISDNIRTLFPSLNLHFLISTADKKQDAIAGILGKINGHPAFNEAFQVLKVWSASKKEQTSFLGLSEGQESIVFSFKTRPKTLAFISLNVSLYKELYQAIQAVHFEMAIFLDTYSGHLKKPMNINGNVFVHRTTQVGSCRLNLKADIYSILQLLREGQYDAPMLLAKQRSLETLTPQSHFNPEEFAFPIALDVINYTVEKQISSTVTTRSSSPLLSQYQLAAQIADCFDNDNLQSWIQFANSCQTMAWGGFSPSQILGAAINTSTNPFIKAIGHMLAELTNLAPTEESHLPGGYNPFLAEEINQIRHERACEETFEMIMYHVMEADSHLPLLRVANNQNEGLLKGKISGWCANALHAAAKAYIGAKDRGIPPVQAARLEFQSAHLQSNWKLLKQTGQHVFEMSRQDTPTNMPDLLNWISQQPESKHMSASINITISDPQYTNNIEAAAQAQAQTPMNNIPLKKVEQDKFLSDLEAKVQKAYQEPIPVAGAPPTEHAHGFSFENDDT